MTVRGGGNPRAHMAVKPRGRMGPPPRSFAADAHDCIMVQALMSRPDTSMRRDSSSRCKGALPSLIVSPTTPSVLPCSELSRCGLAMMGARGNVGATANLDSPCARQRLDLWVGAKKRAPDRTKKLTKKKDEPLRRGLTKKVPYKWARHVGKVVRGHRGRPVIGEGSGLNVALGGGHGGSRTGSLERRGRVLPAEQRALASGALSKTVR
jgi:hypothetical protein